MPPAPCASIEAAPASRIFPYNAFMQQLILEFPDELSATRL